MINHGSEHGSCHAFQVHVGPMRSRSTGHVKAKSRDPEDHPIIDPNYLASEIDRQEFRDIVRLTRELFGTKALSKFSKGEIQPGADIDTDADIDAFVRRSAETVYHCSCTCKMGSDSDPDAVVDSDCKVRGIDNLRVVDASIMPSVVSGNLNGPVIMMAEKAADLILGKTPLPPASDVPVYKPSSIETQR